MVFQGLTPKMLFNLRYTLLLGSYYKVNLLMHFCFIHIHLPQNTYPRHCSSFQYIYIIEGEGITILAKGLLWLLLKRQKDIRLRHLIEEWQNFFQSMKDEPAYDPYWLVHEILSTTTWYDSPAKYTSIANAFEHGVSISIYVSRHLINSSQNLTTKSQR